MQSTGQEKELIGVRSRVGVCLQIWSSCNKEGKVELSGQGGDSGWGDLLAQGTVGSTGWQAGVTRVELSWRSRSGFASLGAHVGKGAGSGREGRSCAEGRVCVSVWRLKEMRQPFPPTDSVSSGVCRARRVPRPSLRVPSSARLGETPQIALSGVHGCRSHRAQSHLPHPSLGDLTPLHDSVPGSVRLRSQRR